MSTLSTGNINSFPLEAAYFGDRDGNTYGHVIDVDDLGMVYIAGVTDSPILGSVNPEVVMVYAKTHWRLTFEARS